MYDDSDEIDYIKGQVLQKFPLLGVTMFLFMRMR